MLPTSAGVEPATSWSPVGRRIQLSHRGRLVDRWLVTGDWVTGDWVTGDWLTGTWMTGDWCLVDWHLIDWWLVKLIDWCLVDWWLDDWWLVSGRLYRILSTQRCHLDGSYPGSIAIWGGAPISKELSYNPSRVDKFFTISFSTMRIFSQLKISANKSPGKTYRNCWITWNEKEQKYSAYINTTIEPIAHERCAE